MKICEKDGHLFGDKENLCSYCGTELKDVVEFKKERNRILYGENGQYHDLADSHIVHNVPW